LTALYVACSIIAAFLLLLCIKVSIVLDYNAKFSMRVAWLFFKYDIYPPRKPKKEKPARENSGKNTAAKKAEAPKKEKKPKSSALKDFYNNQGLQGIIELASRTLTILNAFLGRIIRCITVDYFKTDIVVRGADAAATAIKYGRVCAAVFPLADFVCANMKVKKMDLQVQPDFIDSAERAVFNIRAHVCPLRIIAAAIAAALALLFKVFAKLFLGARQKPKDELNPIHLKGV